MAGTDAASATFADVRRALRDHDEAPPPAIDRGVWIHGAGGFGRTLARDLTGCGVPVLGFIDRLGAQLASVDGHPVRHPDAIGDRDVVGAHHVHGLMNHATPSREISAWASHRGFAGLLFPADLHRLPRFSIRHYWLAPSSETRPHLDRIERVHDALDDDESRSLLRQLLVYRATTDVRQHPPVDIAGAYQPPFMPIRDASLAFIDGGAFTGDTLEALLDAGIRVRDWVAFEPDRVNFERLRDTADRVGERIESITLLQAGLSDRCGRLAFSEGEGAASRIGEADSAADCAINVVRLDDVVARRGRVYVKLDVEGAEMAALTGMTRLLAGGALLAVSIYHRPADLWDIPLYLMSAYPRARFRIRQHGHHGFDTVLYMYPG